MKICRAYGYDIEQIEAMDYLAYLIALKDLADCPIVDKSLLLLFGAKDKTTMSVTERRTKRKRK